MNPWFAVTGFGLFTPVGRTWRAASAAALAGISRFWESDLYVPATAMPRTFPRATTVADAVRDPRLTTTTERLLHMATVAAREALTGESVTPVGRLGSFLALADRPEYAHDTTVGVTLHPRLLQRVRVRPAVVMHTLASGHAGALEALALAQRLLVEGAIDRALVGGADSWISADRLAELDRAGRLRGDGRRDGFTPGEGAGFLLLETVATARRRRAEVLALCSPVHLAHEPHPLGANEPGDGRALARVLRAAASASTPQPGVLLSDLNGERFRFREWGLAAVNAFTTPLCDPEVLHPADATGDLGSASAASLLGVAVFKIAVSLRRWSSAMVAAASDSGLRAACALRRDEEP